MATREPKCSHVAKQLAITTDAIDLAVVILDLTMQEKAFEFKVLRNDKARKSSWR